MLNQAALTSSMVAFLGTMTPALGWETANMAVESLSLGKWSGADAYERAGFGWSLHVPAPAAGTSASNPTSPEEDNNSLHDIVGSVAPPLAPPDDPALAVGIGSFSFCEFGAGEPSGPVSLSAGFGSEARLRRQWGARIESFHYDLGFAQFMALPQPAAPLAPALDDAPSLSQLEAGED